MGTNPRWLHIATGRSVRLVGGVGKLPRARRSQRAADRLLGQSGARIAAVDGAPLRLNLETWTRRHPTARIAAQFAARSRLVARALQSKSSNLAQRIRPPQSTWGGARNRADRTSVHLSRSQCDGMLAAALFAEQSGKPFSRHWTVHHERAGVAMADGAAFVGRLLSGLGKLVRREGGELAAIYAREGGAGKGAHVHIMMHLPPGMTLRNRTRRLVEGAGGTWRKRVSVVRSIGGRLSPADDSGHRFTNALNVLGYLMKSADAETGNALGLDTYGVGALIIGKRCGWTQNIGKTARRGAGES